MAKHEEASCAHCLAVFAMLHSQFHPTDPWHFSGIGQRYPGWSDRPAGVQWSLWHDRPQSRVILAVNLEEMSDGQAWPIGQLIERERADPQFPALAARLSNDIEVWLGRDIWNPGGQGKIHTDDFLDCAINSVTKDKWKRALDEARSAQNAKRDGRGAVDFLLKKGVKRLCEMSSHIHFIVPLWGSILPAGRSAPNGSPLHGSNSSRFARSSWLEPLNRRRRVADRQPATHQALGYVRGNARVPTSRSTVREYDAETCSP